MRSIHPSGIPESKMCSHFDVENDVTNCRNFTKYPKKKFPGGPVTLTVILPRPWSGVWTGTPLQPWPIGNLEVPMMEESRCSFSRAAEPQEKTGWFSLRDLQFKEEELQQMLDSHNMLSLI